MSSENDRKYHRTFLSIYHDSGPHVVGCQPTPAQRQQQRQQEKLKQMQPMRVPARPPANRLPPPVTERQRKDVAGFLNIPYVPGRSPTDEQVRYLDQGADQRFGTMQPQRLPPTPTIKTAPGRRHPAYSQFNNVLEPTQIEEKKDQKFSQFATEWEKNSSILVPATAHGRFVPIVDSSRMVIGHYGRVNANDLFIKVEPGDDIILGDLEEVLMTTAVYVNLGKLIKKNTAWAGSNAKWDRSFPGHRNWLTPDYKNYLVQTDIYGEVVAGEYSDAGINGQAIPVDYSPADFIGAAKLLVKVGLRVGVKMGVATLVPVMAGKRAGAAAVRRLRLTFGYDKRMGIPPEHFKILADAARDTDVIAILRANKEQFVDLIRHGAPGKPPFFKFKTSPKTGVLTATDPVDIKLVQQKGYFLMDADGVARRTVVKDGKQVVEEFKPQNPFWTVEKGQVIDPKLKKPVVGDYDLLGVAPMKSKGSNVSGVPKDPVDGDWTGPWVKKYSEAANSRLPKDTPRVLHGAQDSYKGKAEYMGLTDDTAYAIFPNGKVHIMQGKKAQEEFYKAIGREPAGPAVPPPPKSPDGPTLTLLPGGKK